MERNIYKIGKELFITNDEEIKKGDWVFNPIYKTFYQWIKNADIHFDRIDAKKIILTTDQDLIKDGVQSIDDEFLEWFVKNPSCEEVEIEKGYAFGTFYKIIIPKEEPKQHVELINDNIEEFDKSIELFKQETTLEEAKDLNYWKNNAEEDYLKVPISVLRYITELEKQQERSYSEEIIHILDNVRYWETCPNKYKVIIEEWFKQFKKK